MDIGVAYPRPADADDHLARFRMWFRPLLEDERCPEPVEDGGAHVWIIRGQTSTGRLLSDLLRNASATLLA